MSSCANGLEENMKLTTDPRFTLKNFQTFAYDGNYIQASAERGDYYFLLCYGN